MKPTNDNLNNVDVLGYKIMVAISQHYGKEEVNEDNLNTVLEALSSIASFFLTTKSSPEGLEIFLENTREMATPRFSH